MAPCGYECHRAPFLRSRLGKETRIRGRISLGREMYAKRSGEIHVDFPRSFIRELPPHFRAPDYAAAAAGSAIPTRSSTSRT